MSGYDAYVWTDGSSDREGFGGCAAVLVTPRGRTMTVTDGAYNTTNQKMELMGAIIALKELWWRADHNQSAEIRARKRVLIYSDSAYLVNCFKEGWIDNWRRRDWRRGDGKPVKNREFWETLESLVIEYKKVSFIHIRGHQGNKYNERADEHASYARVSFKARKANVDRILARGREDEVWQGERDVDGRTAKNTSRNSRMQKSNRQSKRASRSTNQ